MHYYKRNIGDYAKKAGRLSMLQHGAYTLLIDSCYDREVFPTMEEAIDWAWASSLEEVEAIEFVLKKFFTLETDGTYTQKRIKEDLDKYHETAETNKRIANEREAKRKGSLTDGGKKSTKRVRSVNEAPPNHKPLTNNQEPLKDSSPSAPVFNFKKSLLDLGVDQQAVDTWLAVRKKKRAVNSELAIKGVLSEVRKAGISVNEAITISAAESWIGFKAEWYSNAKGSSNAKRQSNSPVIDHEDTSWLTGSSEGQADSSTGEPDIQGASNTMHRLEAGDRSRH